MGSNIIDFKTLKDLRYKEILQQVENDYTIPWEEKIQLKIEIQKETLRFNRYWIKETNQGQFFQNLRTINNKIKFKRVPY